VENKFQNSFIILCYLFMSIVVFRNILLQRGAIGFRHDWAIPQYQEQVSQFGFESFYSWLSQSLGINPSYPADFLLKIMFGFLSLSGLGGEVLSKAFAISAIFLSGLFMYYLCRSMRLQGKSSFIAGIFYMFTPVMFNRIVAGQIAYIFAYALSPLVIALFMKSVENHTVQYRIVVMTGLLFAFAGVQIQFLVMLLALLLIYSFLTRNVKELVARVKALSIVSSIVFLVHAFWLIPLIANSGLRVPIGQAATLSWFQAQSPSFVDALRLTGFISRYFESSVGTSVVPINLWLFVSFLIPLIVFSAVVLRPCDRRVIFFTLIAVISLFFAKGLNPPFEGIFVWMFWNIPLTAIFREVYHLMFIPALAFAVLLGISFEAISKAFHNMQKIKSLTVKARTTTITFLMLTIILVYSWPIFTGDFGGNIQVYDFKPVYHEIYEDFSKEEGDFRVLWLPMAQPMTYVGLKHAGINPSITYSPKPSFSQFFPAFGSGGKYTDFLHITFSQNRTAFTGRLLSFSNTKYIISSKDFESKLPYFVLMPRYPDLLNFYTNGKLDSLLKNQKDIELKEVLDNATIRIYENKEWLPHLYAVGLHNAAVVAGDLSSFVSISYADSILNNDNLLIFASQMSPTTNPSNLVDTVIIQSNQSLDYVFSFIPTDYKIDPGNYALENADPQEGWTRTQSLWWYNWCYSAALEDSAFTQTEDILTVPFSSSESTTYDIWAKVYFGKLGSSLKFFLDDIELGNVITKTMNDEGFKWVYLSSTNLKNGNHRLLISNERGENVVQRIVIVPSTLIHDAFKVAYDSLQDKNVILLSELENSPVQEISEINNLRVFGLPWASSDQGFNASQGFALKSMTSMEFAKTIYIPKEDNYEIFIRVDQKPYGIVIDEDAFNMSLSTYASNSSFEWYKVEPLHLQEGNHNMSFIFDEVNVSLDLLVIKSVSQGLEGRHLKVANITYQKVNPTKYIVHVNASGPFFLVFSESYHPSWQASVDGEKIQHFKVNSFANGYYVKKTGNYVITLEFMEQGLYETGMMISFATIITLITGIITPEKYLRRCFFRVKHAYSIIKQTFKNL